MSLFGLLDSGRAYNYLVECGIWLVPLSTPSNQVYIPNVRNPLPPTPGLQILFQDLWDG